MLEPLPIGIQTFSDIIEGGFLYVDKTRWIYEMVRYPKGVYFLSRPRRFGKSLLLSTLEAIFQGRRELFEGLWIDGSDYAWEEHPVIRIDFSRSKVKTAEELLSIPITRSVVTKPVCSSRHWDSRRTTMRHCWSRLNALLSLPKRI